MKKFGVHVKRTYNVYVYVKANSKEEVHSKLRDNDEYLWDEIGHLELEEMDVDPIEWEIEEVKEDNTQTGALHR